MKRVLPLFVMVDACGWEIVRHDPFCQGLAPHRSRLESVFGYSSTCVPSILSGRWPDEHHNWCYFVHDPERSPFKSLRWLQWLPKSITSRRIFRRLITRLAKKRLGFKGYFDLYNIPFQHIHRFDFTEKRSPLQPGGMNRGANIFDELVQRKVPYFVSDPGASEEANRDQLARKLAEGTIEFAFMYWAGLDGLLHRVGNKSPEVPAKLREYEGWIQSLMDAAAQHYDEVHLYVFSDHGMANCTEHVDLMSQIQPLDLEFGEDYAAVYDSTMARFWFFNEPAREKITALLESVPQGRILPEAELKSMRTPVADGYFGELIFLLHEGVLLVPSHMGERPITAMHGYHPDAPQSYAALFTNQARLPEEVTAIPHIHRLMMHEVNQKQAARTADKPRNQALQSA